jgi:hypothetical protein
LLERASEGDKSEHRKNPTEQGTLTNWRGHREGQVRTWKESDQAMHTHFLERASGGASQDTERVRPREAHSRTGEGIGRDKSGHGKNPTKQGALTSWRGDQEGQVRTQKESHQARGHSLAGESIRRDESGHGKNPTERGALTNWRGHREG